MSNCWTARQRLVSHSCSRCCPLMHIGRVRSSVKLIGSIFSSTLLSQMQSHLTKVYDSVAEQANVISVLMAFEEKWHRSSNPSTSFSQDCSSGPAYSMWPKKHPNLQGTHLKWLLPRKLIRSYLTPWEQGWFFERICSWRRCVLGPPFCGCPLAWVEVLLKSRVKLRVSPRKNLIVVSQSLFET